MCHDWATEVIGVVYEKDEELSYVHARFYGLTEERSNRNAWNFIKAYELVEEIAQKAF
jgi:hypothetical protein